VKIASRKLKKDYQIFREVVGLELGPLSPVSTNPRFDVEVEDHFTNDGRSVSQSVCLDVEPTLGLMTRYYFLSECSCHKFAVLFLWGALSDERTGLQFAV
jgi:hypothetical protein